MVNHIHALTKMVESDTTICVEEYINFPGAESALHKQANFHEKRNFFSNMNSPKPPPLQISLCFHNG